MNIHSSLINEMKDKTYRDAYVVSQIRTVLPFQLRALRTSRKWSQEHLAEKAGMAQPRISDLERPTGRMPNLDTLCRIASACDVAVEVRFVPFGGLIDRSESFDPENFSIPTFDEEISQAEVREDAAVAALAVPSESAFVTVTMVDTDFLSGRVFSGERATMTLKDLVFGTAKEPLHGSLDYEKIRDVIQLDFKKSLLAQATTAEPRAA